MEYWFWKRFYATAVKSHVESIARRNKNKLEVREASLKRKNPKCKEKKYQAYWYNLEFDDICLDGLTGLKIKVFKIADKEWMCFIL